MEDDIRHIIMAAYVLGEAGANSDALDQIIDMAIGVVRDALIEGVDMDGTIPEETVETYDEIH